MNPLQPRQIRRLRNRWRESYRFQTLAGSALSLCITALFALYHGFLGFFFPSVWHKSIGVFYFLLVVLRGAILLAEHGVRSKPEAEKHLLRQKVFLATSALLFPLNLSLLLPISLMVRMEKPVHMGKIPAIAMAAYTTYKITMALLHMRKRRSHPVLIRELRTINLIDALVSILTLQNTLIMVNPDPGRERSMLPLSAISSAAIYLLILVITVRSFFRAKNERHPR